MQICSVPLTGGQVPLALQGSQLMLMSSSLKLSKMTVTDLDVDCHTRWANMDGQQLDQALAMALALRK